MRRLIRLNIFAGAYDKVPKAQEDVTWAQLCDELEALTRETAAAKTGLLAFTLGVLFEPYNVNANYLNHTALAIDVDTCPVEMLEALPALGVQVFAYASPSDPNPDGSRRVRIVAELSEPIAPDDVRHARRAFAEMLGIGPGQGVEGADAISQLMFAGQLEDTPARDCWRVEGEPLDARALIATPLELAWRKAAKPGAVPRADSAHVADPDERTAALLEALAPFWAELDAHRSVLRALGGYLARRGWDDDQIAAVAIGLAPDRPVTNRVALMLECARDARRSPDSAAGWSSLVAWSPEAAAVIESIAKDPREPAGFAGVWSERWAKIEERAARKQAEAQAPADDESDEHDHFRPAADAATLETPMFLCSRDGYVTLIFESDELGHRPIHEKRVRLRMKELSYDRMVPLFAKGGKPLSCEALLEANGKTYEHTSYAFANTVTEYDPSGSGSVRIGYPLTAVAPQFDADVDAWLRALGGQHYDHLAVWIASCAQANINRLSACLILLGRADVGKSLFGNAVAALWGEKPPPLALIAVQFNSDMLRCPILVDEEAQLFGSKALSTKRFRDVIQADVRSVERKGKERCQLHGGLRAVVSCNALSDLRFDDMGGPAVVEALRDRMLVIDATARAEACKGPLVRLRLPDDHRVDLPRVVRHMAWLCVNTELPAERFLGAGGDDSEGAILAGHVSEHVYVWESFRNWLDADGAGSIWVGDSGRGLCVDTNKLADSLAQCGRGIDMVAVRAALAPFHTADYRPNTGARPRLWVLDESRVADALGLDAEGLDALSTKLAAVTPEQPRSGAGRFGKFRR